MYEVQNTVLPSSNVISSMEAGNPEGFPVVLLHGNSFSKDVFTNQLTAKELQNFRLIALDLPGHGHSSAAIDPEQTYSYEGFAMEMLDFLAEMNIDECVIAGWSLGGHVGLEMINRSPRVSGVFAFGAPPAPNGPLGLIRSMRFSKMLLLCGKAKFSEEDARYYETGGLGSQAHGTHVKAILQTDMLMRSTLSRNLLRASGVSQRERFENSTVPVKLLHGSEDQLVRTPYMAGLKSSMLVGGTTEIVQGAGHAPFFEKPEVFNRALAEFCNGVADGTIQSAKNFSIAA